MPRLDELQARDAIHNLPIKKLTKLIAKRTEVSNADRHPLLLDWAAEKGDVAGVRRLLEAGTYHVRMAL